MCRYEGHQGIEVEVCTCVDVYANMDMGYQGMEVSKYRSMQVCRCVGVYKALRFGGV